MRIQLKKLNAKKLQTLRSFFANIPTTYTEIEIIGGFNNNSARFDIANALSYLPKHITTVKFSGEYAEKYVQTTLTDGPTYIDVGPELLTYGASLPATVHTVSVAFKQVKPSKEWSIHSFTNLIKFIKSLNKNITTLDLSEMQYHTLLDDDVLKKIPSTVKTVRFNYSFLLVTRYLKFLHKSVTHLDVRNYSLGNDSVNDFLEAISPDLEALDLGNCKLNLLSLKDMLELLSKLPPKLAVLGLSNNSFSTQYKKNYAIFAEVLKFLSPAIIELDLGDNGLLLMRSDALKTILHGLPNTVKRLRLSQTNLLLESGAPMSGSELAVQLGTIPAHIDTLILSRMNFFDLSAQEFITGLRGLPPSVTTLDFSELTLHKRNFEELYEIFANLPPHITALKLCGNKLISIKPDTLRKLFQGLSPQIKEIDFSNNGLPGLMSSQLNLFWDSLPKHRIRIILDNNQFALQNNGDLVCRTPQQHYPGLFRIQKNIIRQPHLAEFKLVMMQLLLMSKLPLNPFLLILSHAFDLEKDESMEWGRHLSVKLISKKTSAKSLLSIQQEAIDTALERIKEATAVQAARVDLSRCGLHRIVHVVSLRNLLQNIFEKTTELSLRGNGFGERKATLAVLAEALKYIPRQIAYLDLSDNGFELFTAEQLRELFLNLPSTVKLVSLEQEKPLSPTAQITLRQHATRYEYLTDTTSNIMQQARIVLEDYTKGDSALWRVMYFHWNRHYTAEVTQLIARIDSGLIANITDLLSELRLIDKSNEIGSLARRIYFLTQKTLAQEEEDSFVYVENDGMEMT